jgi:hypothetical protein
MNGARQKRRVLGIDQIVISKTEFGFHQTSPLLAKSEVVL